MFGAGSEARALLAIDTSGEQAEVVIKCPKTKSAGLRFAEEFRYLNIL
jgi:hypothetical protein